MNAEHLLIIDATGEPAFSEAGINTALQKVVASHLGRSLEVVQAAWVVVGLVGGMENVTPQLVAQQCAVLASSVFLGRGWGLRGFAAVILFREMEEGAVIAANCSFTSCIQTLTGHEPHVIGVSGEMGWSVVADFSRPSLLIPRESQLGASRGPLTRERPTDTSGGAVPAVLLLSDVVAVQPETGGVYTCVNCAQSHAHPAVTAETRRLTRGEVLVRANTFDCDWCQYFLSQIVPGGASVELPWKSEEAFEAGDDRLCYLDEYGFGYTPADFLALCSGDAPRARRCFDLAEGQSPVELLAAAPGPGLRGGDDAH